jgi:glycosyltransferase involved in cell wall biosynthesis
MTANKKEFVGAKLDWQARVCFIVPSSGLGGTETLVIRQSRWMRRHQIRTAIISRSGDMDGEYRAAFDEVFVLNDEEVDPGSLLMDEWHRMVDRLAAGLRRFGGWHFMAFGKDGIFLSSELSARIPGCSTSVYLVDDLQYGPSRLDYIEEMSRHGLFIAMNEECLSAHRLKFGYELASARTIPLPMNISADATASGGGPRLRVLTVARLVRQKGYVEGLIRAVACLVRKAGLDVELCVVGEGPLMARLRWVAWRLGVADRVRFVGSIAYADLPAFYDSADVYVGMGTTVLEAASRGVPCLIAEAYTHELRSPGLFSALKTYELGEPRPGRPNPEAADILRNLLEDPTLRSFEGASGRRKVQGEFSEDVVMRAMLAHLQGNCRQVLNIPSPGHDLQCGETKRYLKRMFRRSSKVAAFRRWARGRWDSLRSLFLR